MAEKKEVPAGNMCQLKQKSEKGYLKVKGFCLMDYVTCYHHSELLPKENSHEALDYEYLKALIQWENGRQWKAQNSLYLIILSNEKTKKQSEFCINYVTHSLCCRHWVLSVTFDWALK